MKKLLLCTLLLSASCALSSAQTESSTKTSESLKLYYAQIIAASTVVGVINTIIAYLLLLKDLPNSHARIISSGIFCAITTTITASKITSYDNVTFWKKFDKIMRLKRNDFNNLKAQGRTNQEIEQLHTLQRELNEILNKANLSVENIENHLNLLITNDTIYKNLLYTMLLVIPIERLGMEICSYCQNHSTTIKKWFGLVLNTMRPTSKS